MFKIFTMVAHIHEGIDLVFRLRNMTEIEGEISTKQVLSGSLKDPFPYIPRIN